jgi:hypothetical protein
MLTGTFGSCVLSLNPHADAISSAFKVFAPSSVKTTGAQWVVNAFKKYINIDISNYRLDEYVSGSGFFALHIRPEDLAKLREDKLSKLFGQ